MVWRHRVCLTERNGLRLRASTQWFCAPARVAELADDLRRAARMRLPWRIIGQGSNVLPGLTYEGLTLTPALGGVRVHGDANCALVQVGAGVDWPWLVSWCCRRGLHGLENLAAIPGTIGAAPVQNIGAYGLELGERLVAVDVLRPGLSVCERIPVHHCGLGYRNSGFKDGSIRGVVCGLLLRLGRNTPLRLKHSELHARVTADVAATGAERPTAQLVFDAVCALRAAKLPCPRKQPNVGSFFLNPLISAEHFQLLLRNDPDLPGFPCMDGKRVKVPAAALIERSGWRGQRLGAFEMSSQHSLVMLHHGGGDRSGALALATAVQTDVRRRFAVNLELEPRLL